MRRIAALLVLATLVACGGSDATSPSEPAQGTAFTGTYALQTREREDLASTPSRPSTRRLPHDPQLQPRSIGTAGSWTSTTSTVFTTDGQVTRSAEWWPVGLVHLRRVDEGRLDHQPGSEHGPHRHRFRRPQHADVSREQRHLRLQAVASAPLERGERRRPCALLRLEPQTVDEQTARAARVAARAEDGVEPRSRARRARARPAPPSSANARPCWCRERGARRRRRR